MVFFLDCSINWSILGNGAPEWTEEDEEGRERERHFYVEVPHQWAGREREREGVGGVCAYAFGVGQSVWSLLWRRRSFHVRLHAGCRCHNKRNPKKKKKNNPVRTTTSSMTSQATNCCTEPTPPPTTKRTICSGGGSSKAETLLSNRDRLYCCRLFCFSVAGGCWFRLVLNCLQMDAYSNYLFSKYCIMYIVLLVY